MNYRHVLKLIDEIRMAKQLNTQPMNLTGLKDSTDYRMPIDIINSLFERMFRPCVENAVVVDVENMVDIARQRMDDGIAYDAETFPDFRLPYPDMWFEYRRPLRLVSTGPNHVGNLEAVGVLARCVEHSKNVNRLVKEHLSEKGGLLHLDFTVFMKSSGKLFGPTFAVASSVTHEGVIDHSCVLNYGDRRYYGNEKLASVDGLTLVSMKPATHINSNTRQAVGALVLPAFLAIQFMNCKNVIQEDREPPQTINERHRRDHPPLVKYKVLRIDRGKHGGGGHSGDIKNPESMPYHICRGHFKRFTAEKPLLGKHVGTYWWEAQARGRKERGEVIKDYEIGNITPPTGEQS